ncbi:hypothetical protein DFA_08203 [Cavenderia fasciculata]|uniref:Uncharacterized protein n=1 Tax=Cavenderia fasciculata TaxID=261658 RepID=F4Q5F7_CACFS|nr:uncharacterized protein DFA_08203 [Cavenderia fasciculata]EGG17216.1 hypothetical protein DFA_08203 [Cavenderia fasciculata]|eukprot:XP_004355700.1 hypothetical protein DFA_08203 [Cavenderia fasciculata]
MESPIQHHHNHHNQQHPSVKFNDKVEVQHITIPPSPTPSSYSGNHSVSRSEYERVEKRNQFLEKELEYVKGEVQSTRRILSEREELLLQLQWDQDDPKIDLEGQKKKKKSKERYQTEEKQQIDRLRQQMRLMENALAERDLNISRLHKELNDTKVVHQQQIEMLRQPVQRSKTSWGFRSSPSSSPLGFKPSPGSSPAIMDTSRINGGNSPIGTPMAPGPNFQSPSSSSPNSPATSSPLASSYATASSPVLDSNDFNKKMNKKPSLFFTFKKDKKKTPHSNIQDANWNQPTTIAN